MFAYIRCIFLSLIFIFTTPAYAVDNGVLGALLGAGVGAAIGHSADRTGGSGKGAAIGAIGGYFIGKQLNKNKSQAPEPASNRQEDSAQCRQALNSTDDAAHVRNSTKKVFLLQNANRICPHNARIHNDLGVAYYQRGLSYDQQRARLELEEALRIKPSYDVARRNLNAM